MRDESLWMERRVSCSPCDMMMTGGTFKLWIYIYNLSFYCVYCWLHVRWPSLLEHELICDLWVVTRSDAEQFVSGTFMTDNIWRNVSADGFWSCMLHMKNQTNEDNMFNTDKYTSVISISSALIIVLLSAVMTVWFLCMINT